MSLRTEPVPGIFRTLIFKECIVKTRLIPVSVPLKFNILLLIVGVKNSIVCQIQDLIVCLWSMNTG